VSKNTWRAHPVCSSVGAASTFTSGKPIASVVEGARRLEVVRGHRDVVERHARTLPSRRSLGVVPIPARPLHAHDLDADPFVQFQRWFDDAREHGQLQPDAMVVATSTPDGRPSARMVLLRGVDVRGFCFYTNFESRKGEELAANPHAAIALHWPEVLRQVRATDPSSAWPMPSPTHTGTRDRVRAV